jgi:DNA-binding GntR family transcriptional regulator
LTQQDDFEALQELYDECIRLVRQQAPPAQFEQVLKKIAELRERLDVNETSNSM